MLFNFLAWASLAQPNGISNRAIKVGTGLVQLKASGTCSGAGARQQVPDLGRI